MMFFKSFILKKNFIFIFKSFWCVDIKNNSWKIKKNIILTHFQTKFILKTNTITFSDTLKIINA
jgi:hypothetical protein